MDQDRIAANGLDNGRGLGEAAGLEHDVLRPALIAMLAQHAQKLGALRAAHATTRDDGDLRQVGKQGIVHGCSGCFIHDDHSVAQVTAMKLMTQPGGLAGAEKTRKNQKTYAVLWNRGH
jgi:hypothetical protein